MQAQADRQAAAEGDGAAALAGEIQPVAVGVEGGIPAGAGQDRNHGRHRRVAPAREGDLVRRDARPGVENRRAHPDQLVGRLQLNDPLLSEQRFDLLARLKAEGLNSFAVRRPGEPLAGLRYPVFLRDEEGASFVKPELLADRAALESALAALPASGFAGPMIVEFCGAPGPDGYYRKYGAFRIGERIVPQHCLVWRDWFIKHGEAMSPVHRRQNADYRAANPHEAELRAVFDAARIAYGRIDYTLREGRIEVFEINTNPAILGLPPTWPRGILDPYDQRPYAAEYVEAVLALPGASRLAQDAEIDRRHASRMTELARELRRRRLALTTTALRQRARRLLQGSTSPTEAPKPDAA